MSDDMAANDIGCDAYGYPVRSVPVSPAGMACGDNLTWPKGYGPDAAFMRGNPVFSRETYINRIAELEKDLADYRTCGANMQERINYANARIATLEIQNEVLRDSNRILAAIPTAVPAAQAVPSPRTMPSRALFCQKQGIGIR
jgi:hypothetical protein